MLEVRNLVKIYKTKKAADVRALDDVSIKFNDTGMVFLLGKSGSGKSTLLNVLGGLDRFDSGEIIIKGKSSKTFTERDFDAYRNTYLGFIFQEYNILPEFSVQKNISLAIELQGKKANKKAIDDLLEQVDLVGYGRRKPNQLSGGQKQRIAIARALVKDPKIIMADEPTGALDSNTGKQVFDTLKKLSEDKLVIVVSHDREFAELYADRIIEMKDGKILSDVTKRKRPPKALSSGFKIVGKSMIHIEKSHKFSGDEAKFLNDVVQSSSSDIIISADPSVNNEIKRLAKIDDDGNSEFFDPTNSSDIIENADGERLKLIKGRLRHKDSFKMGASGLKTKKVRLVITILLSAISLAMFGLADTMASYNVARSNYDSLVSLNTEYLTIAKNHVEINENYTSRYPTKSSDADIVTLQEKFPDYTFVPQTEIGSVYLSSYIANQKSNRDNLYGAYIYGAYELSDEDLSKFGLSLYGENSRLPNTSSKIMITKYQYDLFANYGYNVNGDSDYYDDNDVEINSVDDIIGKKINVFSREFTISGVLDTRLDLTKFRPLANMSSDEMYTQSNYMMVSEFNSLLSYGFHNSLFFKPGTLANYATRESVYDYNNYAYVGTSTWSHSDYNLVSADIMEGVAMFDSSKTQLTSNEVVIPCNFAYDEYDNYIDNEISFYRSYGYYDEGVGHWVDDYRYEVNGTYYYSQAEAKTALSNALNELFPNGLKVTIKDPYNENSTPVEYNVGGIYFSRLTEDDIYKYSVFFKDVESAPVSMQHNFGTYKSIITKMLGNSSKDFEIVSYLSAYDATEDALVIKSQVSDILENFLDTIETLAQVFLYVGIAFAVFSALLLMNFIAISISYKKQEIGILRALGAKGSDVYNIFLNESLIITFINYLVSLFLTIGGIFLINNLMKQELGFYLTLLSFGLRQVILLAIVSLIVALVATFLPTFRVSRMKPIDAIHNRK